MIGKYSHIIIILMVFSSCINNNEETCSWGGIIYIDDMGITRSEGQVECYWNAIVEKVDCYSVSTTDDCNLSSACASVEVETGLGKHQATAASPLDPGSGSYFLNAFPNPFFNNITIALSSPSDNDLLLYIINQNGDIQEEVAEQSISSSTTYYFSVDLSGLNPDIYRIVAEFNNCTKFYDIQKLN